VPRAHSTSRSAPDDSPGHRSTASGRIRSSNARSYSNQHSYPIAKYPCCRCDHSGFTGRNPAFRSNSHVAHDMMTLARGSDV